MNNTEFAVIQSFYTLGGLVGALIAGPMATKYGRLLTMRLTTIVFILGPAAEALASNIAVMSLGRFLSGVGAGASTVVCPIYVAEISPLEKRGLYGAFTQVMVNVGILSTLLLGYFLSHGNYWRLILAIAGMIGVGEFVGLIFAPESPKWLAKHEQMNKARQVLQRIRGAQADISKEIEDWKIDSPEDDEQPLLATADGESPPHQPSVSFFGAMRSRKYRPAVIAVIAAMAAQQLTRHQQHNDVQCERFGRPFADFCHTPHGRCVRTQRHRHSCMRHLWQTKLAENLVCFSLSAAWASVQCC